MELLSQISLPTGYMLFSDSENNVFKFINENGTALFDDDVFYNPESIYTEIKKVKKRKLSERIKNELCYAFFILFEGERIGAFICKGKDEEDLEMWVTALLPDHRRKGIYKQLLKFSFLLANEMGFQKIISQHAATNNPVIIAKLKAGFQINGFLVNDKIGIQVMLVYYLNPLRRKIFEYRNGMQLPDNEIRNILGF